MHEFNSDDQTQIEVSPETLSNDSSRRVFLTKLMAGAAAATTLAVAPKAVFASTGKMNHVGAGFPAGDAAILNYALTLEHLETAFYEKASMSVRGGAYVRRLINVLRFDEQQHVAGLTAALKSGGYKPVTAAMKYNFPAGTFGSRKGFLSFASVLEDTGVHAYHGQVPNIKTPALLVTAAQIATVEARHTGAIRALLQQNPTDGAFDRGSTMAQVLAIAGPLIGK
ncbi:MAG: hypothetical protein NVS4B2_23130 [Chloroflexota bacterium]